MKTNNRDLIINSRKYAMVDIAYNINKMCFLPKIYSNYTYKIDNLIRIMANLLRKDYKTGIYLTSKYINENKLKLKENDRYGIIIEYLKEKDIETGKKEYKYFYMYNVEQFENEDEIIKKYLQEIKNKEEEKHNLKIENIMKFLDDKNEELLIKIIFNGLLNLRTGKNIKLNYRLDQGAKNILIEMCKQDIYIKEMRKSFRIANELLNEYLNNNKLENIKEREMI